MKCDAQVKSWSALRWLLVFGLLCFGAGQVGAAEAPAGGVRYEILHSITQSDGGGQGRMLVASDGKMYGTLNGGGYQPGLVFRLSPGGRYTLLHQFDFDDGGPVGPVGLVEGSDGHFYGVSFSGGQFGAGSLYRMSRHGEVTLLHSFGNGDSGCRRPSAPMIQASDGRFYGTTYEGGRADRGCTFRMTRHGAVEVLHEFDPSDGIDGDRPSRALVEASDGLIYGVTPYGGRHRSGTAFRMNHQGFLQVVHSFHQRPVGPDGGPPNSALVEGPDGQLYGTTSGLGGGAIYKISPDRQLTVIHRFGGFQGSGPRGTLHMGADGTLTGTTYFGSDYSNGNVYQLTPDGQFRVLHSFAGGEGRATSGGVVGVGERDFYGLTDGGGEFYWGTIYHLRLK